MSDGCICDNPKPHSKPDYQDGYIVLFCDNCNEIINWDEIGIDKI